MNDLMANLPLLLAGEIDQVTDTSLLDEDDFNLDEEFVDSLRFWDDDDDEEFWREDGFVFPDTSDQPINRTPQQQDFSTFKEQETGSAAAFRAAESATQNKLGSDWFVRNMLARKGEEYEWGGTTKKTGFDCSGIIWRIMTKAGFAGFPRTSGEQYAHSKKISLKKAINTPGAILWHEGHIAVSLGNGKTIEAMGEDYGVVVGNARGRFTGGGLLPELDMKQTIKRLQDRRRVKGQPTQEAVPKRKAQNIDPSEVEVEDTTPISTIPGVMMTLLGEPESQQVVQVKERGSSVPTGKVPKFVPKEYRELFLRASRKYDIPVKLLALVAQKESGFDPTAQSSAGALGMMQIMPQYHQLKDYFDPRESVMYGAKYLSGLIRQYNGNVRNALAHYNAGYNLDAGYGYADDILNLWRR